MHHWVFTHGSLMNDPPFPTRASATARATGWQRTYGHPSVRNWGTPGAPAPTCSLVPGNTAVGVAHLVANGAVEQIIAREASEPVAIDIAVHGGTARALAWTMSDSWSRWSGDALAAAALANIAAGGGPLGDARDYLDRVIGALTMHGHTDTASSHYRDALIRLNAMRDDPSDGDEHL